MRLNKYQKLGIVLLKSIVWNGILEKVLEKRLDFVSIQKLLNEPELRNDFEKFSRRMRCLWHFRNELSENFHETQICMETT